MWSARGLPRLRAHGGHNGVRHRACVGLPLEPRRHPGPRHRRPPSRQGNAALLGSLRYWGPSQRPGFWYLLPAAMAWTRWPAAAPTGFAPLAIGLTLTLIHLISIPVKPQARGAGPDR
jgi:hypothetical protein